MPDTSTATFKRSLSWKTVSKTNISAISISKIQNNADFIFHIIIVDNFLGRNQINALSKNAFEIHLIEIIILAKKCTLSLLKNSFERKEVGE